jgi:2-polyprenyl-6-methoxyphenol hydroxylase-like FAD-dependent oxidoreductase
MTTHDVLVQGAGIVGQSLALSLGRLGLDVALLAQAPPAGAPADVRAYALNAASVALLQRLKVWDALPAHAATPVHEMQIEGDAGPAHTLQFSSWQQRVGELAWIVDAPVLERELAAAVRFAPHVTTVSAEVPARLRAVCEGKHSAQREALGVVYERHPFGHQAIAARLHSPLPHRGVARQWFRSPDVLALLPFDSPQPGHSHALVWSLPDARAEVLMAMDEAAFGALLTESTEGVLGELSLVSPRVRWPLAQARASRWCGPGWVLLGDAAHLVHPLAGQGLNLGLADVATLSRVIAEREAWRGLDDNKLLRRYARERLLPTLAMGELTGGLLNLFATEQPLLRELRNRGLGLVNQLGPVKRWLAGQALGG